MKKNLLYTALWLMGIMGTLSIWVVSADCWSDHWATAPDQDSTYASGIVYWCDDTSVPWESIPVITIYGENENWDSVGITIKAMNEWTWTVKIWSWDDAISFWSYYQRWNIYPFAWEIIFGDYQTNPSEYGPRTTKWYYNSGVFLRKNASRANPRNIGLRWDEYDRGSLNGGWNWIYQWRLWWIDTWSFELYNAWDRKWMCDTWYHIPSAWEWYALVYLRLKSSDYPTKDLKTDMVSSGSIWINFANDFFMPFAGYLWYNNGDLYAVWQRWSYWSSSARPDSSHRWIFFMNDLINQDGGGNDEANGKSIRCFRNSYIELPQTSTSFTVTVGVSPAAWGSASSWSIEAVSWSSITGTIEAVTGFIKSGNVVLSTVTPNPWYIFSWWTTDCGETLTANCTFTGEFKEILYKVEFTWNNVSTWKVEVTSGTEVALTWNEIASSDSKDGYVFVWWNTDSWANEWLSNITVTWDIILYSIFKPITYTVHYDANEGTWTMTDSWYTYDLSWNLAENTFTKTWYVFSGWMYNNEIYTWNQEIKNLTGINGATITMVTQWAPIKYSVEFTWTDVSWTMANQEFTYDIPQKLSGNAFTKTGYIFSGWTDWTTGYADKQNVNNLTTTDGATLTLTAQWTPITYTIAFSWNAADATWTAPATINAKYDSGDIAPNNSFTRTGYTFTWWNTESNGSGTWYTTWAELKNLTTTSGKDVKLYAQWEVNIHKLNFVVDWTTIQSGDVAYSGAISAPAEPKKDCNSFAGWTSSVEWLTTTETMPDSDVTFTANWNYTCSRSSGWWGGGSSRNTEKTTETQTWSKVDSSTKATDTEDNTQDSSAEDTEWQNQWKTYSDEFQQAYEFAYKHGITTMPTIEQANMEGPLTRIAMAKMLSYYAINVLWLKPDETRVNKFNDVSDQMDAEYNNAVTLAYQLWIMWINMPKNKFRPNDLVTRAEFATALSRMLYKIADWKDKYYSTHLAKLMEEKIITNDNPNLQELRGYVMIMLMRSAQS